MSDERDGIEALRKAIDDVTKRLPERPPTRRVSSVSWAVVAVCVIGAAAIAAYRLVQGPATVATPAALRVEVKLLRVKGRDVEARVFEATRAGTVVVVPATNRTTVSAPLGAVVRPEGGGR